MFLYHLYAVEYYLETHFDESNLVILHNLKMSTIFVKEIILMEYFALLKQNKFGFDSNFFFLTEL